jgi:hypothetical protein
VVHALIVLQETSTMIVDDQQVARTVTIKLYHNDRSASHRERQLVRTFHVPTDSAKQLTAKRAIQVLARTLPQFSPASQIRVIRTSEGWQATRSLQPTKGCSFHYIWEEAVILSDIS